MRKLGWLAILLLPAASGWGEQIDYARQIRPILSHSCFSCHGHDAEHREADLRLDTQSGATAAREGSAALVPGDSQASLMFARITASDPDERMPPVDSGQQLTAAEIELLRNWIDQGAEYAVHWAFIPPQRPQPPQVSDKLWPVNPIDQFVLRRLEAEGLRPAQEADRHTLIRRLSFDLTGLPPTLEEVQSFVTDASPRAYEALVERLLDSSHYGERWARVWMDLARYADTQGYEKDRARTVWPWRDWVVQAFNDDMPYDQFTVEQLAGDLLPESSEAQQLATVFHRHTMTNTEGGTDDEEFRVAAVKDRVDTTGLIWLGLSVGCAKCHSHKYDPISQTEYYRLFAFFNQTADADRHDDQPTRALPSPFYFRQHAELVAELARERQRLAEATVNRQAAAQRIANLERQLADKIAAMQPPSVPVMEELAAADRRATHVLIKGNFLNPGAQVDVGVPQALHPLPPDATRNRLGVARWLMDRENPLTARVTVNRVWSRMFGVGLVETEEDFGTQGELPSHPLLLDWLATEFRDTHRWSHKQLCKTIVMSATYRQSAAATPEMVRRDPRNRLLARGPRFRLEAEMIRDSALAASGLLSRKLYGPPVMPPQPDGIWKSVYNSGRWVTSEGEDRYRRGLYTFAKRTSAYPAFLLLDAGSGEVCLPRRIRTNTATAALATLNDPVFTEAAQALARRVAAQESDVVARVRLAWRLVTGRSPQQTEAAQIVQLYEAQVDHYRQHPDAALQMATVPLGELPAGAVAADRAAWTVVASVLLNLDEVLTKG